MTELAHTPTRVTGTVSRDGVDVTFDYVGCLRCSRVVHSFLGEVAQPWARAHPDVLPATASTPIPDGTVVRQ
jgi:hypothetical protein